MVEISRFRGGREIDAALRRLPEIVAAKLVGNALAAGGRIIRDDAKARVARVSGELSDSIAVRRARGIKGLVFVGFLKPTSRRAHFEEFGSSKQSARPFLRPALDANRTKVLQVIARLLRRGIKREASKPAARIRR